jgi:hypothetical protein
MIEKPIPLEPARPLAVETPSTNGNHLPIQAERPRIGRPMRGAIAGVLAVIVAIAFLVFISSWIQKWLWMREVGFTGVFWTLFSVQWKLFCAAFVVVFLYLWINLRLAARNDGAFRVEGLTSESALAAKLAIQIPPRVLKLAMAAGAAVGALFVAVIFDAQWDTYLRFRYGGSFGLSDPLFGVDTGFMCSACPFTSSCKIAWPHWR